MSNPDITEVPYDAINYFAYDEQVAERERRFRPRVEALGPAGTETLDELLEYICRYKRTDKHAEMCGNGMSARASFNALCRFMGIPIGKYYLTEPSTDNAERAHFWQWCWEIAERRRLETGWQMGMELCADA